ncbi:MAG: 50S ribosomal protein L6 [Candidatus Nealsonbacteria bacterium]|nr:50S ribosomal protein L6 [Candidatus Nealsonbacteria bacterium]
MSRIGKKPILIPEGVEIKTQERKVIVKGPKGELSRETPSEIKIEIKDNQIFVFPQIETRQTKALWGLTRALLANMVEGVLSGFEKKLEIQGIGFKAAIEGEELALDVGLSHSVKLRIPSGINIVIEKNIISVSGIDKETVGQFSANIRKVKPPEPYKGKGIRYVGEVVRRKAGKKAISVTT